MKPPWLSAGLLLLFASAGAHQGAPPQPAPLPAAAPVPKPAPTEYPLFELKDGSRFVGLFSQEVFLMETPYGVLSVPVSEVIHVRFGTRSDPELGSRIDELIRQLGAADFSLREKASSELGRVGLPARRALEKALKAGDAEVQDRAGRLLEALEELEEEPPPEEDELLTKRFLIRGLLRFPVFEVATKYGALRVEKRHLRRLSLQSSSETVSVKVAGTSNASAYVDTRLRVRRGDSLTLWASGTVLLANWGQQSGPEGNPNCGQQLPGIPVGALVARIGPNGPPFKVGESFQGIAEQEGALFLAVGIQQNCAQQNTGEFRVQVRVEGNP